MLKTKTPIPSQNLIDAALSIFTARAAAETLRPIIETIQENILREHEFVYTDQFAVKYPNRFTDADREPKRLISFDNAYEMPEADRQRLYDLLEAEYMKAGFVENRPKGHCPPLIIQSLERAATDVFIEASQELNPAFDVKKLENVTLEKRKEYVELTLRYVGPFVKNKT